MSLRPNTDFVLPRFLLVYLSSNLVLSELQHLAETRSGTFPELDMHEKIVSLIDSIESIM